MSLNIGKVKFQTFFFYPPFLAQESLSTITQNYKENSLSLNSLLHFMLLPEKQS